MVPVGETLIGLPAPISVPPQLPVYHFQEAPVPKVPPVILNVVELPGHTLAGLAEAEVGAVDKEPDDSVK